MLQKLQGRDHMVYTGVALVGPLGEETFAMGTKVRFAPDGRGGDGGVHRHRRTL